MSIDPTNEEIAQFMKEYDAGLHKLSPEDKAALKKSEPEFRERLRKAIYGSPDEQAFSE